MVAECPVLFPFEASFSIVATSRAILWNLALAANRIQPIVPTYRGTEKIPTSMRH
uniref:Uncharacterized protein n=1 Tax=mine drainage metagenome TaxID=410659 RepID=E6QHT8_9ZZZZ